MNAATDINIQYNALDFDNQRLYISLDIDIAGDLIDKDNQLTITPMLEGDGHKQELPLILINGKDRHKAFKMMERAMGTKLLQKQYHIYKEFEAKKNTRCVYKVSIELEQWMKDACLHLVTN